MRRRRSTWTPAPVTPGQVLPGLIALCFAVGAIAVCVTFILWGNRG